MGDLQNNIRGLLGKPCLSAIGGRGNGSMFALELGEEIPRGLSQQGRGRLDGKTLQLEKRGECCLFVKSCAWRLERHSKIICTWTNKEKFIADKVCELEGRVITAVAILNTANDLRVQFGDEYLLFLFCDQFGSDAHANYSIRVPGEWISVGPDNLVSNEPSPLN